MSHHSSHITHIVSLVSPHSYYAFAHIQQPTIYKLKICVLTTGTYTCVIQSFILYSTDIISRKLI